MQTLPLPRLAHNGLAAPTGDDFRDAIRRIAPSAFDGIWTEVCEAANLPRWSTLLDIPELERLARAMSAQPGAVGVAGQGMAVRVASYKVISQMPNAGDWTPQDWSSNANSVLVQSRIVDVDRLEVIADLGAFTEEASYKANELARTIQTRFGASFATVTFLTDQAQVFLGKAGLDDVFAGAPIEWSFCARMVRTSQPYLVKDTDTDTLQKHNPVVELIGRCAYLGVPMILDGQVIGSVCVFSDAPRDFSEQEIAELETYAKAAVSQLQADRNERN